MSNMSFTMRTHIPIHEQVQDRLKLISGDIRRINKQDAYVQYVKILNFKLNVS